MGGLTPLSTHLTIDGYFGLFQILVVTVYGITSLSWWKKLHRQSKITKLWQWNVQEWESALRSQSIVRRGKREPKEPKRKTQLNGREGSSEKKGSRERSNEIYGKEQPCPWETQWSESAINIHDRLSGASETIILLSGMRRSLSKLYTAFQRCLGRNDTLESCSSDRIQR